MSPARECEKGQTNVSDIKNKGERQGERERRGGEQQPPRTLGGQLDTPNPPGVLFQGLLPSLSTGRTALCLPRELGTAMGTDMRGPGGAAWDGGAQGCPEQHLSDL